MIRSLELENFKGIGERQRIEFAPLTLMFGANSAGKSTVLQALLYLLDLIEHSNADVNRTDGGTLVDLGGFERLVHRHDVARKLCVRVEFDCSGTLTGFSRGGGRFLDDLDNAISRAWVEVEVAWSALQSKGVVSTVTIGSKGDWLVETTLVPGDLDLNVVQVNLNDAHHVLVTIPDDLLEALQGNQEPLGEIFSMFLAPLGRNRSAMPRWDEPFRINYDNEIPRDAMQARLRVMVEMLVVGLMRQLARTLRDTLYIGPLRAIPGRGYLPECAPRANRWADGLAAWDALLADRGSLATSANHWLRRVGAGCSVIVQTLADRETHDETVTQRPDTASIRRLLLDMGNSALVLPSEVGAGVSQMLPVIVASLAPGRGRFVMIEQPELHVHPALQVGLGDLFIEASKDRQLLIETHSEHVILRVLRRIRETAANELPAGAPTFTPQQLAVLYVENTAKGTEFRRLRVDDTGEFADRWPKGFFAERAKELF